MKHSSPKNTVRFVVYGSLGLILFVMLSIGAGPSSIDIRVDCGDLRFRYWGIPITYERMREPSRTVLLNIAHKAPQISPRWVMVLPQTTSNCNACEYEDWYFGVAPWAAADPKIARLLVEELSANVIAAAGTRPAVVSGIRLVEWGSMEDSITPDWINDPDVRKFCESHSYVRPEWLKSTTTGPGAHASEPTQ